MQKKSLLKRLYDEFNIDGISDYSLNGLQVDSSKDDITKVACATDVGLEVIERAARAGADMLFVHHGLFWGREMAVTGAHYRRIKTLMDSDMALFAAHLPLDLHPRLGNNIQIAQSLGLRNIEQFGLYHGTKIGFKGFLPEPMSTHKCALLLGCSSDDDLKVYDFGKALVRTVAIISGGAGDDVVQAIDEDIDLYITGEHEHKVYHTIKEAGINVIFAGHYHSEIFGVRAVCDYLCSLGLEAEFIDCPTGM